MRIKVIQPPAVASIDGVRLDQFRPGNEYQLGNLLACVFLAEGWAEPVDHPETGSPEAEVPAIPRNLTREFFPPYYDGSPSEIAAEHASRHRDRPRPRRRK